MFCAIDGLEQILDDDDVQIETVECELDGLIELILDETDVSFPDCDVIRCV